MLDPLFPCANAHLLYPIENAEEVKKGLLDPSFLGIKAESPKKLKVTLKNPTPYFLKQISFCVFFPIHSQIVQKNPKWADHLGEDFVVSGPYRIKEWKRQDQFILEKNPYYHNEKEVSLQEIKISLVQSENTALEMFCNKELDIIGSPYTNIPLDAAESLFKEKELKAYPVGKTLICTFNLEHPYLKNPKIRKALALSIDKDQLVEMVGVLDEIPAQNVVPPVLKGGKNTPLIEKVNISLAQKYLKEGLEELGISKKELESLSLLYRHQEYSLRISQVLQQMWLTHLGLYIPLESCEGKFFLEKVTSGQYTLCQLFWVAQYDDPMNILDRFKWKSSPKNYPRWENQRFIELLNESAHLSGKERMMHIELAEKVLLEDMPFAPLFHSSNIRMTQGYVKGVYTSSLGSVHLEKIFFEND